MLAWVPERGRRNQGHPSTRWSNDIVSFRGHASMEEDVQKEDCFRIAPNRELWASLEDKYVAYCRNGDIPELDAETVEKLRQVNIV